MENNAITNQTQKIKSYNLFKLENFLSKVVNKLEEGAENIGKENENTILNWLSDLKKNNMSDQKFTISFNEEIYREKLKLHSEEENSMNLSVNAKEDSTLQLNLFYDNIRIVFDDKNSPHQKEEAFDFISRNLKKFDFTQNEEKFLLSHLNEKNWETINGVIMILGVILEKEINNFDFEKIISAIDDNFVNLIKHQEYRLRANLANLFKFSTQKLMKTKKLEIIKKWIIELFSDVVWNFENTNQSENIQHPTLETTKNILNEILLAIKFCVEQGFGLSEGVYQDISDFLKNPSKSLIINLQSENKGIRSTSYEILKNLIFLDIFNCDYLQTEIFKNLSFGLLDFYPQNRYTASLFLLEFTKHHGTKLLMDNKFFFEKILPKICLNRYIPVEGVKNTSLEIWKLTVETNGVKILKQNFENYSIQYLNEMNSKSHSAREAACRCFHEIIMKVYDEQMHSEIIDKYQIMILNSVEKCYKDPCWNVRESGLYSAGYIFNVLFRSLYRRIDGTINFTKEKFSRNFINFADLVKSHLFDNIYEVRAASAFGVRTILSLSEKQVLENLEDLNKIKSEFKEETLSYSETLKYLSFISSLINQINNHSQLLLSYEKFNSEIKIKIEHQNSLILQNHEKCCQKSKSSDKCVSKEFHHTHSQYDYIPDLGFTRDVDLWEYTDGIIHLIKELFEDPNSIKKIGINLENLLMNVIDYFCKNYATLPNLSKKTFWIAINTAFEKIQKSEIDFYFEYVQNFLFKEINENLNNISVFEAENLLITISKLKGKRYVMNKIKNYKMNDSNKILTDRIEKLLNN